MLHVNPSQRPDCTKLLLSPIIKEKENQFLKNPTMIFKNQSQTHSELLKTIIFPKDITKLTKGLPDPRYEENRSENSPTTDQKQIK